jgi:hypothetical protein
MPGIFSRISKARDARLKKKNALNDLTNSLPAKPRWDDAYTRKVVDPEEVVELIRCCSEEIKTRGMECFASFCVPRRRDMFPNILYRRSHCICL